MSTTLTSLDGILHSLESLLRRAHADAELKPLTASNVRTLLGAAKNLVASELKASQKGQERGDPPVMTRPSTYVIHDAALHETAAVHSIPVSSATADSVGHPVDELRRRPFELIVDNQADVSGQLSILLAPVGTSRTSVEAQMQVPSFCLIIEVDNGLPCVRVHSNAHGPTFASATVYGLPDGVLLVRQDLGVNEIELVDETWIPGEGDLVSARSSAVNYATNR